MDEWIEGWKDGRAIHILKNYGGRGGVGCLLGKNEKLRLCEKSEGRNKEGNMHVQYEQKNTIY